MTTSDSGTPPDRPRGKPPAKGIAGTIDGDLEPCWLCGRSVTARALFCHGCGAVLPPRPLDPFARLGLERRFDIDPEQLTRQYAGFGRSLDPERFTARGSRQQANARAQADALDDAYEMLRDPVRRARCLLSLMGADPLPPPDLQDEEVAALATQLAASGDAATVDRLAQEIAQRIETCIRYLGPALRHVQSAPAKADGAVRILARLDQLETLAAEARSRRSALAAGHS